MAGASAGRSGAPVMVREVFSREREATVRAEWRRYRERKVLWIAALSATQRLGKVLVERPRELVAAMPRQRSHQRNPVECCVSNAHAGHPVCSSAIAAVPALDMRHTVRRRRVPTGTKLDRQCAMANILKGRGRAVPARPPAQGTPNPMGATAASPLLGVTRTRASYSGIPPFGPSRPVAPPRDLGR